MGGPPISERAHELLEDAFFKLKRDDYDPVAKEILAEAAKELRQQGNTRTRLPKLRKAQDIVKELRKKYEGRTDQEKSKDYPWSLGSLTGMDLDSDAVPAILQVSKLWLLEGKRLTRREANWVARLCKIIPNSEDLGRYATRYAKRERRAETLWKSSPYTYDIDDQLTMGQWEWVTYCSVGNDMVDVSARLWRADLPLHALGSRVASFEFQNPSIQDVAGLEESVFIEPIFEPERPFEDTQAALKSLMCLDEINFTEEMMWVYVLWLVHLRSGPIWPEMTADECLQVILELREWVKGHPWADKRRWKLPHEPVIQARLGHARDLLKPTHLLKKLGLEE